MTTLTLVMKKTLTTIIMYHNGHIQIWVMLLMSDVGEVNDYSLIVNVTMTITYNKNQTMMNDIF